MGRCSAGARSDAYICCASSWNNTNTSCPPTIGFFCRSFHPSPRTVAVGSNSADAAAPTRALDSGTVERDIARPADPESNPHEPVHARLRAGSCRSQKQLGASHTTASNVALEPNKTTLAIPLRPAPTRRSPPGTRSMPNKCRPTNAQLRKGLVVARSERILDVGLCDRYVRARVQPIRDALRRHCLIQASWSDNFVAQQPLVTR